MSPKKYKILICDDEERHMRKWQDDLERVPSINKKFRVDHVESPEQFRNQLRILERRREAARDGRPPIKEDDSIFDDAAILIVDYDLLRIKADNLITGESVAYMARCYSRCKVIVALNQFGDNTFDLTLKGHPDSYADLNVGGRQISSRGLWEDSAGEFRPWAWPWLPDAINAFEERVQELKGNLNESILDFLGFPPEVIKTLPRTALGFIAADGEQPEEATFKNFLRTSGNGLRGKDVVWREEGTEERIVAARIAKWLERLVLPGQDILVDAPHLAARFPSLLKKASRLEDWNKTASRGGVKKLGIKHEMIESYRFKDNWLSRPAWFWRRLESLQDIHEVARPWEIKSKDFVFCEDTSEFAPLEESKEFVADLPSPFVRRHVKHVMGVDYRPAVRFSM